MTVSEQIRALLAKRGLLLKDLEALNATCVDGETIRAMTDDEQKKFDEGKAAVEALDKQLASLRSMEAMLAAQATPLPGPAGLPLAPTPGVEPKPWKKQFEAQAFTRMVGAIAASKGNLMVAERLAERWKDQTPEVCEVIKAMGSLNSPYGLIDHQRAATAIGTSTGTTYALPLVFYQNMVSEFIELLRPVTVIDKLMPRMRKVPFNIRIPMQTGGATANWVGETLSKPVSALAFDMTTVPFTKIAVIAVISTELARFSTPSAEQLVRDDLRNAVAQFMDVSFLDPTITAIANVRPASITNGAGTRASSGSTVGDVTTDLSSAILALTNAFIPMTSPVWIMSPTARAFLGSLRTAQDVFAFAEELVGGTLMGIPVAVSQNIALSAGLSVITLVDLAEIMIADDGDVAIDATDQASLQMDSAPASPPTPLVSLWQQNLLGIKAERFVWWGRRRPGAVATITGFPAA